MTTRRAFLGACGAAALAVAAPAAAGTESLAALAERSGRFFGTSLTSGALAEGGRYRGILERECAVWVPEWELKWGALVRDPQDAPNFAPVDDIVAAAKAAGKRLRGHTLLWHEHLPEAVTGLETARDWDRVVAPHIRAVAERYRDAIFQWDVVNEAVEPEDGEAGGLRRTPFLRMLGPGYVAEAFRLAQAAAPEARLYLNDYGVCYADGWQERRRAALLRLVERLLSDGAPLHGFGIQGHLDTRFSFDERVFARFLETLAGFGLEIVATELDVREADDAAGRDLAARQVRAADEVRKVLSVALDNPALTGIVTWGLSDSESWLRKTRPIPDNQGLPYDDRLRPAPMRTALAGLLAAAPKRHG